MEKRKHKRVKFEILAVLYHNLMEYRGQVINLSMRGALIEIDEELNIAIDSKLDVTLLIIGVSSTLKINFKGTLARKDGNFLGFKIDYTDIDSFIHLKNIIAYNSGDFDKIMDEFINNLS
jgi:hypothetical protein